jgi:hypothetical protein
MIGLFGSGEEVLERGLAGPTDMGLDGRAVSLVFELEDDVVVAEIVVGIFGIPIVGIGRGIAVFMFISFCKMLKSICNMLLITESSTVLIKMCL